jgi:hypothetical protein
MNAPQRSSEDAPGLAATGRLPGRAALRAGGAGLLSTKMLVAALLVAHALLLAWSAWHQFATRNEVAHVPAAKVAHYLQAACRKRGLVVAALLAWSLGSSLSVYPHSLSYFNELAGGPANGHRHLLDSNIDWGQDLLYLKDWAAAHPEAAPLGLAYFNYIDYRVCGVEFASVPPDPSPTLMPDDPRNAQFGPHPGWFAVDLHSRTREAYQYFERFQPVARAGWSICIYRIRPEEANRVRREMGLAPLKE